MFVRSSKVVLHLLAATLIGLVLVCGFVVWQLSRGPISIGFLTPYVEEALTIEDSPVRVRLGDTVLTWAGIERTLDVRAVGLDVLAADGTVLASIPEISVRFSARALLRGLIAPTSLELLGPRVFVVRQADGSIAFNMATVEKPGASPDTDMARLVNDLLARPDKSRELGYLKRIGISSALVEFEDRQSGMHLTAPRVNLAFERDGEGIRAAGSVAIDIKGKPLRFQVSGILSARSGSSEFGLTFAEMLPGTLIPLAPELGFLADVAIPINGTVALSLDREFVLDNVSFDFDSPGGEIALPALYGEPRTVSDVSLRGRARDGFRSITIEAGGFSIGEAAVSLTGTVVRRGNSFVTDIDAGVRNFATGELETWWPASVATNARDWVVLNLRDGKVEQARVSISGTAPLDDPAAFRLTDLDGRIEATDVTVQYLYPMEPVRGVNAVGTFDQSGFVIDATAGALRNNTIEGGRVVIAGLDGDAQGERISVDLLVTGSVRGVLEVLDQKPLQFIRRVDVNPAQASGNHRTQLIVQFPLLKNLQYEDIRVAAATSLAGFALKKGPFGLPISDGAMSLQVDTEKMVVDGNLAIAGVPAGVAWTEWFSAKTPTRRTYQVRAILNDAARAKLNVDLAPWVTGPVGVGLTYSEAGIGVVSGAAEIDLTNATMAVDAFGWRKSSGIPGRTFLRFSGDREHIRRLDRFTVAAADLAADGELSLRVAADGKTSLAQVTMKRLAFGNTDVFAAADIAENGAVDLSVGGRQLDLRREVAALDTAAPDDSPPPTAETNATPVRIRVSEAAPIGTVMLGETTTLTGLSGMLRVRGSDLREASLSGALNGKSAVTLDVVEAGAARSVRLVSEDGGALIDALDLTDTIIGGRLELNGALGEPGDDETFTGQVDLTDFRLSAASSVSRALTLASFSGISDAISGQGLAVRRAEVPLSLSRDTLGITDAKLRGSDIGVLATGRIDRRAKTIDLAGEIAPAYTLNSLLGNIPLIGTLLTGGGDGIFAASFSVRGPLDNPGVSVNPLTVLTPGIIRRLLTGFGSDNQVVTPVAPDNDSSAPGIPQPPGRQ